METTEKIYCCDRGDNDNALAAAILAGNNRRDDWGPMAATGSPDNWKDIPIAEAESIKKQQEELQSQITE